MDKEIKVVMGKDHIYLPVDCPWPSPESDKIKAHAINLFDKLVEAGKHSYIVLVASSHWASEGYWIEFSQPKNLTGGIVKLHDTAKLN